MADGFRFAATFPEDGTVLDRVVLEVHATERVAIFGPNGAGKSSLLRCIAGTVPGAERNGDVAYLPQTPYMFRGTGRDNLLLGAHAEDQAMAIAERLAIVDILDTPAHDLSGGEAQRVAIARTLAGSEPVVALDEPLAPIDGADRQSVSRVIRDETEGRALICVSHSIDNAAVLAESLVVLDDGHIVQSGSIAHVLATPYDEKVARLVGVANVIQGEVAERADELASVTVGTGRISVLSPAPIGSKLVLKVPAETIAVFSSPPAGASIRSAISGVVVDLIPRGGLVEVVIEGEVAMVALVTPGALHALDIDRGSHVWFGVKAAAVEVIRVE